MEKYEAYKKELRKIFIGCGVILAFFIILSFPIIRFDGKWIALFAPTRPANIDRFTGWVLGSHILETEHGEIRLGRFSQVSIVNSVLATIDIENFQNGRSSHNLVIEGITIPANVAISFNSGRVSIITMHGLRPDRQEIIISGIPVWTSRIDLSPRNSTADVTMLFIASTYVSLTDARQIHFTPYLTRLNIYRNDERWVLRSNFGGMPFKLPGENEFTEYSSITFRPDWGEFIEGELFE